MRKVTFGLVVLGVLALAFISMPMRAQKSRISGFRLSSSVRTFANISRTSHSSTTAGKQVQSSGKSNTE